MFAFACNMKKACTTRGILMFGLENGLEREKNINLTG